ncbi:MAG: HAMP domain-containing histidine kinase [Spirochaetes bacterium]|nr:HAMP domain-containing histidine kinase [Spirochaetota bacterium]
MTFSFRNNGFMTEIDHQSSIKPLAYSLAFVLVYIIFSSMYIWLSGKLATQTALDIIHLQNIELIKGLGFVFVTGAGSFIFLFFNFRRIKKKDDTIIKQNKMTADAERLTTAAILSSSVVHDINNLLSIISGNAQMLNLSETVTNEEDKKSVNSILKSAEILNTLTNTLLKASKGHVPDVKTFADLNSVILETAEFARKHRKVKHCSLNYETNGDITLEFNTILFSRALMNLILNAAEATDGGGEIIIKSIKEDANVILEVHDSGPGVADKVKEKILDPFYTTKENGNGLGLLSLKMFLNQHKGTMEIKKSELGGACFHLILPDQLNGPAIKIL